MCIYRDLSDCHPRIKRGQVWCVKCGRTEKINPAECFRKGWPVCCGLTMVLDSPEERNKKT